MEIGLHNKFFFGIVMHVWAECLQLQCGPETLYISKRVIVTGPHLSAVAASEQDEHSPRGDGRAKVPLVLAEGLLSVILQFAGDILRGVVAGLQKDHTFSILQRQKWPRKPASVDFSKNNHHLAELDHTAASVLVSSDSLDNCCPRSFLYLFLNLRQKHNMSRSENTNPFYTISLGLWNSSTETQNQLPGFQSTSITRKHREMQPTEYSAVAVNDHVPLTLVLLVLVFRLYMALRAYIAEREYRPILRARPGLRLPCFFLADFLSPSAIWNNP